MKMLFYIGMQGEKKWQNKQSVRDLPVKNRFVDGENIFDFIPVIYPSTLIRSRRQGFSTSSNIKPIDPAAKKWWLNLRS